MRSDARAECLRCCFPLQRLARGPPPPPPPPVRRCIRVYTQPMPCNRYLRGDATWRPYRSAPCTTHAAARRPRAPHAVCCSALCCVATQSSACCNAGCVDATQINADAQMQHSAYRTGRRMSASASPAVSRGATPRGATPRGTATPTTTPATPRQNTPRQTTPRQTTPRQVRTPTRSAALSARPAVRGPAAHGSLRPYGRRRLLPSTRAAAAAHPALPSAAAGLRSTRRAPSPPSAPFAIAAALIGFRVRSGLHGVVGTRAGPITLCPP